jgi:hypothetical protein
VEEAFGRYDDGGPFGRRYCRPGRVSEVGSVLPWSSIKEARLHQQSSNTFTSAKSTKHDSLLSKENSPDFTMALERTRLVRIIRKMEVSHGMA